MLDQAERAIVARGLLNSLGESIAKATEKLDQDVLAKFFSTMKDHTPYTPLSIDRASNILSRLGIQIPKKTTI